MKVSWSSNGSLPPGGWLIHLRADCLYTGITHVAPGPTLGNEYARTEMNTNIINSYMGLIVRDQVST